MMWSGSDEEEYVEEEEEQSFELKMEEPELEPLPKPMHEEKQSWVFDLRGAKSCVRVGDDDERTVY